MRHRRGFTLLEMIVATTIMAVAIVGLLSALTGAQRNAARLRDYDRVVQLARLRMDELLVVPDIPRGAEASGTFDKELTGGIEAGWRARLSSFEMPPEPTPDDVALDRVELVVWWRSGLQERTFTLDGYRRRLLKPEPSGPGSESQ